MRNRNEQGQFDARPTDSVINRFESRIFKLPIVGCWLWTGALHNDFGHGAFKLGNRKSKVVLTHRFSWELYEGKIPTGMHVCHRCDNPSCVNPHHLFIGTASDNADDKVAKGRQAKGTMMPISKINDEIAAKIKMMKDTPTKILGELFGLSRQSVADIRYGRTWKHVKG